MQCHSIVHHAVQQTAQHCSTAQHPGHCSSASPHGSRGMGVQVHGAGAKAHIDTHVQASGLACSYSMHASSLHIISYHAQPQPTPQPCHTQPLLCLPDYVNTCASACTPALLRMPASQCTPALMRTPASPCTHSVGSVCDAFHVADMCALMPCNLQTTMSLQLASRKRCFSASALPCFLDTLCSTFLLPSP